MTERRRPVVFAAIGAILAVILGVGLSAGWLLSKYDEDIGFDIEAGRIAEVLELSAGMSVADVRAGSGKWSVDMARRVGESGHVYATAGGGESTARNLFEGVADSGLDNVTVITRTPGESGRLPLECCDGILVRGVFHHLRADRQTISANLLQNLKPGGRIVIIDYDVGSPEHETGHGIASETLVKELREVGFELQRVIEDWEGTAYCAIFRRAESE